MADVVEISALGQAGDGIVQTADDRIYVPFTLPGETVEIERSGNRGRAGRIVTASPDRIAPLCQHFGTCGGCALQHMARPSYLAWKRQVVADCFSRQGITVNVEPAVPIEVQTRRRAVFSAIRTTNGVVLGFHRRGTGRIVPIAECPVMVPPIVDKLGRLTEIAGNALRPGTPARIVVLAADNGLDIAVYGAGKLERPEFERLGRLAGNPDLARLTIDGTQIFLNRQPNVRADGLSLLPAPGGFVQTTAKAEAALAAVVVEHVGDATPVADLFAGIGTFALRLARHSAVTAVEGSAELLDAIGGAWNATPGLKAVTLRRRDLHRNPLAVPELNEFGAVVFDPPSAGAWAQAEAIAGSKVPKVVAISCNPATLARDARILIEGGYQPVRVVPVDQFLFSAEIEVVATFRK